MDHVYSIPGKLTVRYDPSSRAIIDTWTNYGVTLAEFRAAVLEKGLSHARAKGGKAWIVDSSAARGSFSQEIQDCIDREVFPAFAHEGIKHFISITSHSAVTRMSILTYQSKVGPHGIILVEASSEEDAVAWLLKNA
ncbi:MAG: hypothetical protein Q8O14_08245 [bacterium]|jgi:hypothetical protein|nr:hypothetical protein [bacterium]